MKHVLIHNDFAWDRFCRLYPALKNFPKPSVTLNNRLSKTAGRSFQNENRYDLSSKFYAKFPKEILMVVLPHEIAHQVDYNLHGWHKGKLHHNANWCAIMGAYGLPPNPYHTMKL